MTSSGSESRPAEIVVFRLYVTGESPNALRALANLRAVCDEHLPGRHRIEVVDVLEDPLRMLRDQVVATPTLMKVSPAPTWVLLGDLSDRDRVLRQLGLDGRPG